MPILQLRRPFAATSIGCAPILTMLCAGPPSSCSACWRQPKSLRFTSSCRRTTNKTDFRSRS
eukprot:5756622-Prorocentrum_lima.AAC.1